MNSKSEGNFEVKMLVMFTFIVSISASTSVRTKFEIFAGRSFSSTDESTTVSISKAECIVSISALTNDLVNTIGVYNEGTKSCTRSAIGSQSLFLQETGNTNTVALWNPNVCSLYGSPDSVYYEYVDTDLFSYGLTNHQSSSVVNCAEICVTTNGNAHKGFLFHYNAAGPTYGCSCKSVTVEEYKALGNTLNYLAGFSYYDRLCYN